MPYVKREKIEGMKYCPQCREYKSISEFGSNRARKDKLNSVCKFHANVATKEITRKRNPSQKYIDYLLNRIKELEGG